MASPASCRQNLNAYLVRVPMIVGIDSKTIMLFPAASLAPLRLLPPTTCTRRESTNHIRPSTCRMH